MLKKLRSRFNRLRFLPLESYYTLSGWRFADLKNYIDQSIGRYDDAFLASSGVDTLLQSGGRREAKIALVTCLPPDQSGIANFSLKHICASSENIDVFCPLRDVSHFLRNAVLVNRATDGRATLRTLSSLLAYNEDRSYERIVFVIGNSDHNVETLRSMESVALLQGSDRSVCYLHDPCCHNVVQQAKRLSGSDYLNYLEDIYEKPKPMVEFGVELWSIHQKAVDAGMLGVRALVASGANQFIVNSEAAAEMVKNDLASSEGEKAPISVLFHPSFPLELEAPSRIQDGPYVIGTYGAPEFSKRTDVVIDAVSKLRDAGHNVELRIAGYRALHFVRHYVGRSIPEWLHVIEPLTERDSQVEMSRCDVAIQLRKQNLGESSGVVPTLLRFGISTLVSPSGSFREYGDSVIYFNGDASALAEILLSRPTVPPHKMATFVHDHSLEKFEKRFRSIVQDSDSALKTAV